VVGSSAALRCGDALASRAADDADAGGWRGPRQGADEEWSRLLAIDMRQARATQHRRDVLLRAQECLP
jgi:hypothetical protein